MLSLLASPRACEYDGDAMTLSRSHLTERNEEIIRLYVKERLTLREVGGRFGLSRERVRQILERAGVPRRKHSSGRAKPVPTDMWERKAEVIHLYLENGLSLKQTGERFGRSHVAVINLLKAAGIRRRSRSWRSHWPWRDAEQRTQEIARVYVQEGLSLEQIAARFDLNRLTVRRILQKAGVNRRSRASRSRERSRALTERNQEIARAYLEEGQTLEELGGRFGLSPSMVSRILKTAAVTRKPPDRG